MKCRVCTWHDAPAGQNLCDRCQREERQADGCLKSAIAFVVIFWATFFALFHYWLTS